MFEFGVDPGYKLAKYRQAPEGNVYHEAYSGNIFTTQTHQKAINTIWEIAAIPNLIRHNLITK